MISLFCFRDQQKFLTADLSVSQNVHERVHQLPQRAFAIRDGRRATILFVPCFIFLFTFLYSRNPAGFTCIVIVIALLSAL